MTEDMHKRWAKHERYPPPGMAEDVRRYQPFDQHFSVTIDAWYISKWAAVCREEHLIAYWRAHGGAYNKLSATPGKDRQFRYLRRNRLL